MSIEAHYLPNAVSSAVDRVRVTCTSDEIESGLRKEMRSIAGPSGSKRKTLLLLILNPMIPSGKRWKKEFMIIKTKVTKSVTDPHCQR